MRSIEKQLLLQSIDAKWREHLLKLEHLSSVVGFRGYAQRDPLSEYKNEAFQLGWRNVNREEGTVFLATTKSGKPRTVRVFAVDGQHVLRADGEEDGEEQHPRVVRVVEEDR